MQDEVRIGAKSRTNRSTVCAKTNRGPVISSTARASEVSFEIVYYVALGPKLFILQVLAVVNENTRFMTGFVETPVASDKIRTK